MVLRCTLHWTANIHQFDNVSNSPESQWAPACPGFVCWTLNASLHYTGICWLSGTALYWVKTPRVLQKYQRCVHEGHRALLNLPRVHLKASALSFTFFPSTVSNRFSKYSILFMAGLPRPRSRRTRQPARIRLVAVSFHTILCISVKKKKKKKKKKTPPKIPGFICWKPHNYPAFSPGISAWL